MKALNQAIGNPRESKCDRYNDDGQEECVARKTRSLLFSEHPPASRIKRRGYPEKQREIEKLNDLRNEEAAEPARDKDTGRLGSGVVFKQACQAIQAA